MTPQEYARVARAFHTEHKLLVDELEVVALRDSAKKLGKSLLGDGSGFIEVVTRHQALLTAMLEWAEEAEASSIGDQA